MPIGLALAVPPEIAVSPVITPVDPVVEVGHLRSIVEKQPSCLMRVGADGTLLAISDAAISLLGAGELAQVINGNLMDHLPVEAVGVWSDFACRVLKSGSGSAECEMTDLAGVRRWVVLAGVALRDHPDGLESLLVTARDVTAARRLEASLQEQEGMRQSIEELRAKLAAALADRQQFELAAADRDQLQASLDQAAAERQRIRAALDEAVAERQQIANELEQMVAERDELERIARDREAKRQRLLGEQMTGRMKAEEALTEARTQVEQLTTAITAVMDAAAAASLVLGKEGQK
jgi:chaperonin cofactor prefoldin